MAIFFPTSISGCTSWYAASAIGTVNGGPVMYWQDIASTGNNLLPPASSNIPKYYINAVNGYPAVGFNGTTSQLQTASTSTLLALGNQYTLFSVFNSLDSLTARAILANQKSNIFNNTSFVIGVNGVPSGFFYSIFNTSIGSTTTINASSTTFGTRLCPVNTWMLRSDRFPNADGFEVFGRYGAECASGTVTSVAATVPTLIMGQSADIGSNFSGYIAEVVIYNRVLNTSETEQVNSYLMLKYNIDAVGGIPLFLYADTPTGIYRDFPLYTAGKNAPFVSGTSLYTESSTRISGIIPLFTESSTKISGVKPLYIGNSTKISGVKTLFIDGKLVQSNSTTLYTESSTRISGAKPLYIGSSTRISGSVPLFTVAVGHSTVYTDLYLYNQPFPSMTGGTTLYTTGPFSSTNRSGIYKGLPLFTRNNGPQSHIDLFLQAPPIPYPPKNTMALFISGPVNTGSFAKGIPLFIQNNVSGFSNTRKLFIAGAGGLNGGNISHNSMFLYMGKGTSSPTLPLFMYGKSAPTHSITMYCSGVSAVNSSRTMFISGKGASGTKTLYIQGPTLAQSGKTMYIYGRPSGSSYTTLYVGGF